MKLVFYLFWFFFCWSITCILLSES